MRRQITLMRHGHAAEQHEDYDRLLSPAGRAQARAAGQALRETGTAFDHVLTSLAPRARDTAELVAEACGYAGSIQAERALYLASDEQYLAALQQLPDSLQSVLLVAHNPGLTALARRLCRYSEDLRPAQYVSAHFDLADWSQLG